MTGRLSSLCLDLFLLSHAHLAEGESGDGFALERRIRNYLEATGLPNASGFRVFGRRGISGLYHQIDEQTDCGQATVIGEWKAYRGQIPKNDLLRFKAVTDDYWLAMNRHAGVPTVRIFGGTGNVTDSMRTYAAQWGIILITPDRWPVPALCDLELLWASQDLPYPHAVDVRALTSLIRPLDQVIQPRPDGSWRLHPIPTAPQLASRLDLWRFWSEQAWAWWDDAAPGRFDWLLEHRTRAA